MAAHEFTACERDLLGKETKTRRILRRNQFKKHLPRFSRLTYEYLTRLTTRDQFFARNIKKLSPHAILETNINARISM